MALLSKLSQHLPYNKRAAYTLNLKSVKSNYKSQLDDEIIRLFRIDISHTTIGTSKEKETGLGLILCKEYLLKYWHDIKVESILGKGTTFYFKIDKANPAVPMQ